MFFGKLRSFVNYSNDEQLHTTSLLKACPSASSNEIPYHNIVVEKSENTKHVAKSLYSHCYPWTTTCPKLSIKGIP